MWGMNLAAITRKNLNFFNITISFIFIIFFTIFPLAGAYDATKSWKFFLNFLNFTISQILTIFILFYQASHWMGKINNGSSALSILPQAGKIGKAGNVKNGQTSHSFFMQFYESLLLRAKVLSLRSKHTHIDQDFNSNSP